MDLRDDREQLFANLAQPETMSVFFERVADDVDWTVEGTHPIAGRWTDKKSFIAATFDRLRPLMRDAIRLEPRHLVVDYKTNWLGPQDAPLTVGRYTPARMADAMIAAHYPLQALLYAVAVHRLLRWRQPGYDPERHLGGVLYLFVRGMAGPQTPVVEGSPCGVFSWHPPVGLVTACSDLLDGDRR